MKRLLVVDDEVASLQGLRLLLRADGYEVVALSSPVDALERLASEHFDAVITDLEMPGVHGTEVVSAARAADPELLIVVITAYGGSPAANAALERGARRVLDKPLEYDQLASELQLAFAS